MNATMLDLINELWFLKRDIVSDDYDRALARLVYEFPPGSLRIHAYPTGTTCWTWQHSRKVDLR
jgi:hypothetical protein